MNRELNTPQSDEFKATEPLADLLKEMGFEPSKDNPRVRFKDGAFSEYGDLIIVLGAITTQERFEHWRDSLCHLKDDGRIMCYGKQIGTRDDLEFLPTTEAL